MKKKLPILLSASRRTDIVACYPQEFINRLKDFPPENVHSVVIWTKNPFNLIELRDLRDALVKYNQIYLHLTITGMGDTALEPKIPKWKEVVKILPEIIKLVKGAQRVTWRFDPIVHLQRNGEKYTNYPLFSEILPYIASSGITTCRTSFVSPYKKVIKRLENYGFKLVNISHENMKTEFNEMLHKAKSYGVNLLCCSMEDFEISSCIDGRLLSELHPKKEVCDLRKDKGQRKWCGCTESYDIGWYSMKCLNGCLYCYANPA